MSKIPIDFEQKFKKVENRIKAKNKFTRSDIAEAIDVLIDDVSSLDELKEQLKILITEKAGIKEIGFKTYYSPREDLVEVDKTLQFLDDIFSFSRVRERFGDAKIQKTKVR